MDVDEKKSPETKIDYSDFNVNTYASMYDGRIKVDRLLHIARVVPELKDKCYEIAAKEVDKGIDVTLYDKVTTQAQKILGGDKIKIKAQWMGEQRSANEKKVSYLDDEIQRWRNLSNRERICASYLAAAEYCSKIGNYNTAISRYIEAKSYASDTKMLLDINLKIMIASIKSGQLGHVKSEAQHALSSDEIYKDNKFRSKILACLGLYYLNNARYDMAVTYFIDCSFQINDKFKEIISGIDIARYGGLCALASFNRQVLKRRVLDNAQFKRFLELEPNVFKLVKGFYDSEYGKVMSGLNNLKKDMKLDMYLSNKVENLLTAIRGKALVQYFSPYSAMDIKKMASAFNVSLNEMEKELSTCIGDGHIKAKIDSHSKIVYASKENKRSNIYNKLIKVGNEFNRDMKAILLRTSLNNNNVIVSQTRENMMAFDLDMDDDNEKGGGLMSMGAAMFGNVGRRFMGGGGQGGGYQGGNSQRKRGNYNQNKKNNKRGPGGQGGYKQG